MKKQFSRTVMVAAITGLALVAWGSDDTDQSEFPTITRQPTDEAVKVGSGFTLSVQATNGALRYQWLRNGVVMDGQTNSDLTFENVGTNDVALYSCDVTRGAETVPTRAASLNIFIPLGGGGITIYGTPVLGSGGSGTCPGPYIGYVNYIKTVSQGWGWAPDTNTTVHTAADGTTRTDTRIQYGGRSGDTGCNQTSVTIPDPPVSTKYRFTLYFTNNVPTNSYPMLLNGFNP